MASTELQDICKLVRTDVLTMTQRAGSSHVGSNFSMVELLVVLYKEVLRIDPQTPLESERDRFILSKGHGCAALYSILAECGFFPQEELKSFFQNGSMLAGHVTSGIPGVELSTGSLGHGLPVATGMALSGKRDRRSYNVYCLISDGECDEGSTWESILFAPQHNLDNLTVIVDYNKIQSLGTVDEVIALEPFAEKWRAFGWSVCEIDGHDLHQITNTFNKVPFEIGRPNCIIAHTIKGKGVSFMEDKLLWHYRSPQGEEFDAAIAEVGAGL